MFVCPECGASSPVPGNCPNDRFALAPIGDDLLLGTTIGAYRVARLLGVGGMGRVYKGVQPQIGSRVAIKVLSRECSDRRDLVERFFSEARAVNLIRHESIVNVLDLSSLPDGRPYIIMEYLDGAPLAAMVESIAQSGPLPLGSIARLVVEVLEALDAAHAKGIVHRDLKPDNLYVAPSGRPKILDFGIAKLKPELGGSYTQTGSLLGTPHYMSPEQAAGRPVDFRSDLYAMGVILFECVTGSKPFQGDSLFDLLRKQVDAPPPLPSMIRPDMPPALEQVILVAMAKQPDQRWASAQAMSGAIQQAVASLPPEQWAPLTAGGTGRAMRTPSGAGWNPTPASYPGAPPASYPGAPPASYPGAPPPSYGGNPSYPGAPRSAAPNPTTVSGQTGLAPPPGKSNSAAWIAGAILLAGGGITAAVVASRSPATPGPTSGPTPTMSPTGGSNAPPPSSPYLQPVAPTQVATIPADQWLPSFRALSIPNWDPKNVDVDGFMTWAIAVARQAIPDAQLARLDVSGVYPDGHADITLNNGGFIVLRFWSPSRSKRDPSVPVGAQPNWHCMFQVMATVQTGPIMTPSDGMSCEDERIRPAPRCSIRKVWQSMVAKGAPGQNAVAMINYLSPEKDKAPMWYTNINGAFAKQLADDCP
ncbi:MAG TPA: protein kinase [Kofleriaceae bacterium]